MLYKHGNAAKRYLCDYWGCGGGGGGGGCVIHGYQGWGQVQYTCTWYLYLSTYLSVLDVLEFLVYGNVKVLVLVLVLDQKVLWYLASNFEYYLSVKVANYLNTLL